MEEVGHTAIGAMAPDFTQLDVNDKPVKLLKFWDNSAAKEYRIRAIPQNFLIDPGGKIVGKNLRGEALSQKLETLLADK